MAISRTRTGACGVVVLTLTVLSPVTGNAGAPTPPGQVSLAQEPGRITFAYDLPRFDMVPHSSALAPVPAVATTLRAPGLRAATIPGQPDLPSKGLFVALPPGATARLVIDESSHHDVEGIWIAPPATTPDEDAGGESPRFTAIPDPDLYATDAFFPSAVAVVAMRGVARDVDFAKIEINPFRWNPVRRVLQVYDHIRFHLEFDGGAEVGPQGASSESGGGGMRLRSGRTGQPASRLPVAFTEPQPTAETFFANAPVPASWRVRRDADNLGQALASVNPAASGEAFKIEVTATGLKRVAYAASIPVTAFSSLRLALRGSAVPIQPIDRDGDGNFGPGDAFEFYGVANPDRWTTKHVYWLTTQGGGSFMQPRDAFPAGSNRWPTVLTSVATARLEQNEALLDITVLDPGVWNPWVFSRKLTSANPPAPPPAMCTSILTFPGMDQTLAAPFVAPPDPARTYQLRGRLAGRVDGACYPDLQRVDVMLNSAAVGSVSWSVVGEGMIHSFALRVDAAKVLAAGNLVHLEQPIVNDKLRWVFLDFLELDYERYLQANAGVLEFRGTWPAGGVMYARGFASGDVEVVDVRSDGRVERLRGVKAMSLGPGMPTTIVFSVPPESGVTHSVAVYERGAIPTLGVFKDTPSALRDPTNRGRFLAISHPDFKAATQELSDWRSREMSAQVVDLQDVFDEFSYGNIDWMAIRDFLSLALSRWAEPPLYVALVGDSTQDFQNFRGFPTNTFFLPHHEYVHNFTTSGYLVNSDFDYQTLVGTDVVPDLLLGRIAAQTSAEVSTYVAKVKAYETSPPATWNGRSLFFADEDIEFGTSDAVCPTKMADPEQFLLDLSNCYLNGGSAAPNPSLLQYLMRSYNFVTAKKLLIDAHNAPGVAVGLYVGHGSKTRLGSKCETSGLAFFGSDDLPSLTNTVALPLFTAVSCNVGDFTWDSSGGGRAMGENFTLTTPTGDIAFIASTTSMSDAEGRGQMEGFLDGLFRPGSSFLPPASFGTDRRRAGAIHFASQMGLLLNPRISSKEFQHVDARQLALLGDPAVSLRIDDPAVAPPAICP